MNENAPTLYLCCRPSVSISLALALFHMLRTRGCDVFFQPELSDEDAALRLAQIEARTHFLILLTPGQVDAYGHADDPLRCEAEHAIDKRRCVVPLLTNGFSFQNALVPDEIDFLRRNRALTLAPDTLSETVETLCTDYLNSTIFGRIIPTPPDDQARVTQIIEATARLPMPSDDELRAEAIFNDAFTRGRQDTAGRLADYDEALRLNPRHVYARFNRALARRRSSDETGALDDYTEVLRLDPTFYKAFNNRAEIRFSLGDYAGALDDYEQATRLHSNYTMSQTGKALTLHALGRIDEALALWRPLLEADQRYDDAAWVGREHRLPPAMIDEIRLLTLRLSLPPHIPNP